MLIKIDGGDKELVFWPQTPSEVDSGYSVAQTDDHGYIHLVADPRQNLLSGSMLRVRGNSVAIEGSLTRQPCADRYRRALVLTEDFTGLVSG